MKQTSMPTAVPEPGFAMLTRVIASPPVPEPPQGAPPGTRGTAEPMVWTVGQPHPLAPDMKVVRMFLDCEGVEVYSLSSDGKAGMRHYIPMSWIQLIEESMPLDVFVEELAVSKDGSGGEPEPEATEARPAPAKPNKRTSMRRAHAHGRATR